MERYNSNQFEMENEMEQRRLKRWEVSGFFVVIILGILLFFLYEWTGQNTIIGIFGPVNGSVWEKLKLLFMPVLIYTLFEYVWIGGLYPNLLYERAVAVVLGLVFIIIFYYTYSGILGQNISWIDMGCYCVAVLMGCLYSYNKIKQYKLGKKKYTFAGLMIFLVLFAMFCYFTFMPPRIGLFQEFQ